MDTIDVIRHTTDQWEYMNEIKLFANPKQIAIIKNRINGLIKQKNILQRSLNNKTHALERGLFRFPEEKAKIQQSAERLRQSVTSINKQIAKRKADLEKVQSATVSGKVKNVAAKLKPKGKAKPKLKYA